MRHRIRKDIFVRDEVSLPFTNSKPCLSPLSTLVCTGSVIRSVFQQLEKVKVLQVGENGGRTLTSTGRRDLDRIASQVAAAASK